MPKLFIVGHPGKYGGAGTELHHQIILWRKHMNIDVTIIPSHPGFENEPLRQEMLDLGVKYASKERDYSEVTQDDLVMNFCGKEFLADLPEIIKKTKRTAFVNCMTYLFDNEKIMHRKGLIAHSLYQRIGVLTDHKEELVHQFNSKAEFHLFSPYFHEDSLAYHTLRDRERFTIGRISRQDADKFSKESFHIWEYVVSPKYKKGIVLGFDKRSEAKVGAPHHWMEVHPDHNSLSVSDFYASVDVIIQSTDTTENLPRIGFEAMHAGVPLIVDNRGGWKSMIEHGVTGFLCNTPQEFIYWGSRMAFEPEYREEVAKAAKEKVVATSGVASSKLTWEAFFLEAFK
jgi:glycosyltransferase involved in cell wall biosynthesis